MVEFHMFPYAFFEGDFVPSDQAKVNIATHALQYGTGCFGGIRGYVDRDGTTINIFRLRDHTQRLLQSARLLRANVPYDADDIAGIVTDLIRKNAPRQNVYIRPFIYKAELALTPRLAGLRDALAIYMIELDDYLDLSAPVRLMVSSWQRIEDNIIPSRGKVTGAYINSSLAKDQASDAGYDDAIMLNRDGKIAEASGANIFIVRHGTLITPPVTEDILEGITRRSLVEFARDAGIPVAERSIDRSELYIADEAFLCGTGVQIAAIGSIDGRPIGDGKLGPVTSQLQSIYFSLVRGDDSPYRHYLTQVTAD
ncbi:branched-chain amino acid transaminase [Nitrolancea hollandica]|uniref:Branched-chain-amino-acid aminotransferase n=1 Tax=Nitrolancea hollandica Lb TaxID=1129897 RepID=I4EC82_9BACT|nr:branched-chain amino acid transaminase [Nitrolancea hollandica]CCF82294.1 putative branched-chain-amino-acid aminotransferase [Nitrolancea hollandica Lb]